MTWLLLVLEVGLYVAMVVACGPVAQRKGRDPVRWQIAALLFTPLMLILLRALPPGTGEPHPRPDPELVLAGGMGVLTLVGLGLVAYALH